ncbi:O-acyltransferase like protein-like isoform X1 [Branchiostoma lanceolatum]|uniref:O-acyltransferase like protein-like isoform X1 n=1 Tax=Branchiostoma lanceolatum TaxID=7740 RepID=UPI0034548E83
MKIMLVFVICSLIGLDKQNGNVCQVKGPNVTVPCKSSWLYVHWEGNKAEKEHAKMKITIGTILAVVSLPCCLQSTYAQSPALTEFVNYFVGLEKNKPIDWKSTLYFLNTGQLDPTCYNQAYTVHNDTILTKSYAANMLDSTGKLTPSGMFQGNWLELGDYRECTVDARNAADRPEDIEPMYCLVLWGGIPGEISGYSPFYTQGVCVPKSCSDRAVGNLTWTGFLGVKPMPSWFPVAVNCQREETYATYSAGAIVALIIVSIMLGVLAVSTVYEFKITMWFSEEERKYLTVSGVGRFFLSCSVYSNTKKLFNTYQHPGQLPALHGIRVISTLWIIYGHTNFFTSYNIDIVNKVEKAQASDQWWYFIQGNMDMAVDTFLLLSGLLVTYLFMKQMKKTGGQFTWGDYGRHVLHRYFRLTPVYAFLIMIFTCFTAYMGSGPWWALHDNWTMPSVRACQTYWGANLLYINNYVGQGCFGHGWYLAVDMQLYVTLAGVLVILYRYPKAGAVIACSVMALGLFLSGLLYHFVVNEGGGDYVGTTYQWTFTRMAPYFMGMLLGYWLFSTNRQVPNNPNTRKLMLLGWVVGTACALFALVTPFRTPGANLLGQPAWRTFDRSLFSAGVAWVVYACCVGYGGIISEFLSWSGWMPLSRLTYTAYLIHPMIMQVYYMSYKGALLYSGINWWFLFVSFSFLAFACGFAASMMAEVPFLELEKFVLPKRRGREAKSEAEKSHDNVANDKDESNPNLPLLRHGGYGTTSTTETARNGNAVTNISITDNGSNISKSVNMERRSRKTLDQAM